uniref:Methyltransferase FkbM domain-containing protein n=1 Tax=viral metagenome TaxID=1070528 RepID=A0A6C0H381_9ZZZZ
MSKERYTVVKNKDSYGGDYRFIQGKSVPELKAICDYTLDSIGFNSIGYLKKEVLENDALFDFPNIDLYIRQDRIDKIVKQKKDYLTRNIPLDITFVITTCKRLKMFIETMDKLILHCQDLFLIKNWVCIDDNSSEQDRNEMKQRYPFFEFIMKSPEQKGHAKSLNIVFNSIDTKYVFFFEDDWRCNLHFSILPYVEFLEQYEKDQVIFHGRSENDGYKKLAMLHNKDIYSYSYNPKHKAKKDTKLLPFYEQFEKEFQCESDNIGFFYPGFSLNPSIFNIEKIKRHNLEFSEDVKYNDCFELRFAFECLKAGFKTSFTNILICHIGDISSYILNNNPRCFDSYSYIKHGVKYVFEDCGSNPEWFISNFPTWEEETFNVFETVKNKKKIAIDIGGWIGTTCIWLCQNFKHVIVIEVDKLATKSLELNCKASQCSNYTLIDKPISNKETKVIFGVNKFRKSSLNESMSQIKEGKSDETDYEIDTITFAQIIKDRTDIGFIKIDIEGGEENILEDVLTFSLKNKIPVYISFHLDWWIDKNSKRFNSLFESSKIKHQNIVITLEKFYSMLDKNPFESFLFC